MRRRPHGQEDERQRPYHGVGENYEIVIPRGEVYEQERDTWTGLYDHNGVELHRPREPIGYRIR